MVYSTGEEYTPNPDSDTLISNWGQLPFKNIKIDNISWLETVNSQLDPVMGNWTFSAENISFKCLSYAASTINDWFNLEYGLIMPNYKSYTNGIIENGTNPRQLEAMYYSNAGFFSTWGLGSFRYVPTKFILKNYCKYILKGNEAECESISETYKDPITQERIPYNLKGYAILLVNPENWVNQEDPNLQDNDDFNYTTFNQYFNIGEFYQIALSEEKDRGENDASLLKDRINKYGIIYSFTKHSDLPDKVKIHSVAIIGYGSDGEGSYFIFHDSYGDSPTGSQFKYGKIRISDIVEAYYFIPNPSWPTYHHDNRRTGMTLLKGTIHSENDADQSSILSSSNVQNDVYSRTTIGDIDNDERMEIVTGYSTTSDNGWIISTERRTKDYDRYRRMKQKWEYDIGHYLNAPATLADINNDKDKEVIFGLYNGTLIVLDVNGNQATKKWSYTVTQRNCDGTPRRGKLAYTTASDIDNDGKVEVIFADSYSCYSSPNWEGKLYVLEDNGATYAEKDTISINNDGAYGAISVADIDSDDKQEIIVPTYYGVRVYDYDNDQLTAKTAWNSNADGRVNSPIVVYDIDKDNKYEFIYMTTETNCGSGKTCYNKLYIRDSTTANNEVTPISTSSWVSLAPSIGDIDGDGNPEIMINVIDTPISEYWAEIRCYELDGSVCSGNWPYDDSASLKTPYVSPNIVDIDGDGKYDILIPGYESSKMYLINGTGDELFTFEFGGEIGSSPAIGDFTGNSKADVAVKRAGSDYSIISFAKGLNNQPTLNQIENITAIAGNIININESGTITATDEDSDALTFYYSSPFNSSGLWQSTINDTGNYSILVEVSDGNLSDYNYVEVTVFNSTTGFQNQLNDSSTSKELTFSGSENQTVYIRVPKNVTVIYSELKLEGKAP